jgi:hypothetical protein
MEQTNNPMELTNDPIVKDMIGTIKHLTAVAYNKGYRDGVKANRLRMADLLNQISEEMKKGPEPTKNT